MAERVMPLSNKEARGMQISPGEFREMNRGAAFPARLRALRAQKGLSQQKLAWAINVTLATVAKFEQGETVPDARVLRNMAGVFGVSYDYLLCATDLKTPDADAVRSVYIEPTTHCNLRCSMCARSGWQNEATGHMDTALAEEVLRTLPGDTERIFFGGVGEPLCHPDILGLIRLAKKTGRRVELITNGTLLDAETSRKLIESKLDMLWVSVDSLAPGGQEASGGGAHYIDVMGQVEAFSQMRGIAHWNHHRAQGGYTELGIAFVLMKDNLSDFNTLLGRANSLGIREVKATHLIPYAKEQLENICYERILGIDLFNPRREQPLQVNMPLMQPEDVAASGLAARLGAPNMEFSFLDVPLGRRVNHCKFVAEGQVFVRWDGEVCPCMALLHDAVVHRHHGPRTSRYCSFGSVKNKTLEAVWQSPEYVAFRRRVRAFNFSPCAFCGSCDLSDSNETDCVGSPFPSCGACLWAQGFYQCP